MENKDVKGHYSTILYLWSYVYTSLLKETDDGQIVKNQERTEKMPLAPKPNIGRKTFSVLFEGYGEV